jgi:hypothetical protein
VTFQSALQADKAEQIFVKSPDTVDHPWTRTICYNSIVSDNIGVPPITLEFPHPPHCCPMRGQYYEKITPPDNQGSSEEHEMETESG